MSKIACDACQNLREYAPEFVNNGVTDTVSASLKNNTGFNPSLTSTHTDCEDLNDANDCLIGQLSNQIEAHDVCDWKDYMHKFVPNLYELLKAGIASTCGLWTNVNRLWKRTDVLCDSMDSVFDIIKGNSPKHYRGEWFPDYAKKLRITLHDRELDPSEYHPTVMADILTGSGCDTTKKMGRWGLGTAHDINESPYQHGLYLLEEVSIGERMGIVYRKDVPTSVISESRWKRICRNGGRWAWGIISVDTLWFITARGWTFIDGVEFNETLKEYGEDNLVFYTHSFIGPSRKGWVASYRDDAHTYDI